MLKIINKIVDNNIANRHNNFVAKKEIYDSINNFINTKKADKLRKKNQEIIANTLTRSTFKSKEEEYINALMTGQNLTGALLYDWDKKDGDPTHNGGYKFAAIKDAEAYKKFVSKHELELFTTYKNNIANTILFAQPERIIDMGGGDGIKTTKILDILPTESIANVTLTSKDISGYLLEEYTNNVNKRSQTHNNSIKTAARYENFLDAGELISNTDKKLFLFKGGTIGQFNDDMVVSILKNMFSEKLFTSRYSIVTMFLEPEKNSIEYKMNIQKLLAAYGTGDISNPFYDENTHTLIKDWIMSGIEHWLGDQVKGKLEFNVSYRNDGEKGGAIELGAKVLEPISIKVGDQIYSKQPGDTITAIQSRRFSKKHFAELAQKGGHKIDAYLQDQGVGIAIMHTNKLSTKAHNPVRIAEFKRKIKLFLAGTLIIGSIGLGVKIHEVSQKSIQEKRWKQDVKNELGYTDSYYGPTESGLQSSREIYEKYLSDVFGISNPSTLKYDFLARYIEAYKRGDIRYGGRMGGYEKTIEVLEKYIVENKLRIKFDKGIEFIPHKELASKEDILLQTYNVGNIEITSSDATSYNTYKLKDEDVYYEFDYFFKEANGKTLIFARPHISDNKNKVFSTNDAQKIIIDYFTPLLCEKISGDFYGIIQDDTHTIHAFRSIKERLIQLNMEGYNFDYSIFFHDNYSTKAKYFMQTFMPQYKLKDETNMEYNLSNCLHILVDEILVWNPSIATNQNDINALRSTLFTLLLRELNPQKNKKELKEWLVHNYNELGLNNNSFVFQYKPYESEVMSTLGLIDKDHNDVLPSSNSGVPFYSMGEYTTKKGEKFEIGIIKKISGNTMAAKYIGGNKDFISQAKDSIEKIYLSYQYGWRSADLATIQEGKNSDKIPNAETILHVRDMKRFEVQKILDVPNTYFANIVYEDWLSK